ncbi:MULTISPECIES: BglG family transcription antiterminator [Oceanobacillus]|uniref:Ascorbate-specific PTS system EIIA component n=1 Tax=Oceanobacillus sojae TaxID=582851 RepID=A0A511ZM50_9BACI|nr:BglG family transcription antiterminator [Oceanobacillus sojae]GEN88516.1 PTS sugar transporter subunit IIA [Oceanobacillus sojae]
MDKRVRKLLNDIVYQPGVSMKELSIKHHLSLAQIEYAIKKANQLLKEYQFKEIQRINNHLYAAISQEEYAKMMKQKSESLNDYFYEVDRQNMILLMLLLERDISLISLSLELGVSKNTILKDLKEVELTLKPYRLSLIYTRKAGYVIKGPEIRIRQFMLELINHYDFNDGWFHKFINLTNDKKSFFAALFEEIERELKVRFSDETIEKLPIIITLMRRRVLNDSPLSMRDMPDLEMLWKENAYKSVSNILHENGLTESLNKYDISFMVIQILGGNLLLSNSKLQENSLYFQAIQKMVHRFESMMTATLAEKEDLYQKLYQHLIPAMYRIKYGVPLTNPIADQVKEKYGFIHSIIQKAIEPVEEVMGCRYSQDELVYITMLFVGAFSHSNQKQGERLRAIVLCENGVSISYLLTNELKKLFPEITFERYMSKRAFLEENIKVDLIFSTIYMPLDIPCFQVTPFLSDEQKQNLRHRVFYQMEGMTNKQITTSTLMNIIKQHADIRDYDKLKQDIQKYILEVETNPVNDMPFSYSSDPQLCDLITENTIQIATEPLQFEEAIRKTAEPLIDQQLISPKYVDRVLTNYKNAESYFVISQNVAIPHVANEGDVFKLGMSLLKLDEPIYFANEGHWIQIVILIAPFDKEQHMDAIAELHQLVLNQSNVERIIAAETKSEIIDCLYKLPH